MFVRSNLDANNILDWCFIANFSLILLAFPFSPLICLFFCIFYLIFLYDKNFSIINYMVGFISILCVLFINNSRLFFYELEIDLSIYYDVFKSIQSYGIIGLENQFGGGVEVGWSLIYYLFKWVNLDPYELVFINNLICMTLTAFWLFKYGVKEYDKKWHGLIFVSFLVFFPLLTINFLQRQALSSIFLLFALSNIEYKKKFLFWVVLASVFHLSAIIIGCLFWVFSKFKINFKWILTFFVIALLVRIMFYSIVTFGLGLAGLDFLVMKLEFYSDDLFKIESFRYILFYFVLAFFIFINYRDTKDKFTKIIFYMSFFYFFLIGIPLLPDRINMAILFVYGFLLFKYFGYKNTKLFLLLLLAYVLTFIVQRLVFVGEYESYWQRYPFFSYVPFYYLGL